jgi:choline kinase
MKAVILAAGAGGRLHGVVVQRPKCLARVGDCTLLQRQLRSLHEQGIDDVTVVAGFKADEVARFCRGTVSCLINRRFATTNSLYSLWLARHLLADGFVVLNCDVLFHPQLLADLLGARHEDAVLVAARAGSGSYSDEEMQVHIRRGLVVGMAKAMDDEKGDAENIGIAKFGREGAAILIDQLDTLVTAGMVREWLPRAFTAFAQTRPLHVVDSRGYPWIEIDFPEDYWRACSEVLPAIEGLSSCMNASTTYVNARSR